MGYTDIKNPNSIKAAVDEFKRVGRRNFLEKYGFGCEYFLVVDGERFDSKAIIGAAHGYEFPAQGPLRHGKFSGGLATAERKLHELASILCASKVLFR